MCDQCCAAAGSLKFAMFNAVEISCICVYVHTVLACPSVHTALILYYSQPLSVGTYPTALAAADFTLCVVLSNCCCFA
jgi:hypothetical protein